MADHLLKLAIHAIPGARQTHAVGAHGDALRVRLAAPPLDGKANMALIAWVAKVFGVPKARVQILRGTSNRHKLLCIEFSDAKQYQAAQTLVSQWMNG